MNPTETGILILGGIVVMAITAFIVQSIENERRERHMRLLRLRDQIRRANHLYHNVPRFYVPQEVYQALLHYMENRWKEIIELEPSANNRAKLEEIAELRAAPFETEAYPEGALTYAPDRETARRLRALLRELAQFFQDAQTSRLFSNTLIQRMVSDIKQGYTRLTIELELMDAKDTEELAGLHVALHQYRSSMLKLQQFNDVHQIDPQIFALSRKIEICQAEADRIKSEQEAQRKAEQEEADNKGLIGR